MPDYEKLGVFYLGRPYDPVSGKSEDGLILYDSKDLVTHAVCFGMTGSGKTGLCLALVVSAEEAAQVRTIFALYLELGSLLPVVEELARRGWTLKRWRTRDGKTVGGKPFTRPRLHQLL